MAGCIASEPGIAPAKPSRSPHTRLATTTQPVMIGPVARSSAATPVTDFAINRCIYRIIVAPSGKGKSAGSDMILQGTYDLAKMGFRRLGAMACRRPVNEAQTVQRSGVLYAASPLQSASPAANNLRDSVGFSRREIGRASGRERV